MNCVLFRVAAYALVASVVLFSPSSTRGQCAGRWLTSPEQGALDFDGPVYALLGQPNGDIIAGGSYRSAGGAEIKSLANWNGRSWSAFGSGLSPTSSVFTLIRTSNGNLIAGGTFSTAGGVTANRIARWNGTTWTALGSGMNNTVWALAVLPNGDVVAGGDFLFAGGVAANRIARWNGSTWSPLGTGITAALGTSAPSVRALQVMPDGSLIACGNFIAVGDVSAYHIARWDGSAWSNLGPGLDGQANALTLAANGDLIVGGNFTQITGGISASRVARWDGTDWSPLGTGFNAAVAGLATLPNGNVVAVGSFTFAGATTVNRVAVWDGTTWTPLGTGLIGSIANAVAIGQDGEIVVGGLFSSAGGVAANSIARWKDGSWAPFSKGLINYGLDFGTVLAFAPLRNGDVVVGGRFTAAGAMPANGIARWSGNAWSTFGPGLSGTDLAVLAIAEMPNGDIIAGGDFETAGGVAVNSIARWDGASWTPLGTGLAGGTGTYGTSVYALMVMPTGDLIVGGNFRTAGGVVVNNIARWDGSSWSALGAGVNGEVRGPFALLPNGDLVAGGAFTTAGGAGANFVARWDGTAWHPLGAGVNAPVRDLKVMSDGALMAGGFFTSAGGLPANYVARWDGATWSALGTGLSGDCRALAVLTNGDLVAGGNGFTMAGGVSAKSIARWNGASWSAFGSGMGGNAPNIYALAVNSAGELLAGGSFTVAGGLPSGFWSRWSEDGVPWIADHPAGQSTEPGQTVVLAAVCASGYDHDGPVAVHWERNGVPVVNGAGGASPGGGTVIGAMDVLIDQRTDASLSIEDVQVGDSGAYVAVFSNSCGAVASQPALVVFGPVCDPDVNQDGNVDQGDVDYLINVVAGGDNSTGIDPDFTRDGNADQADVDALVNVVAGGACP